MIIFQKPGLKINWNWNICLNGYKLICSDQIKYLGIYLDKYLNGHYQTKLVIQKLARSLGMLSKVRHYVSKIDLKNIYHAIFESHLRYGCQIWYQFGTQLTREKVDKLQKKALRIMSFKDFREPSSPLFKDWKILKMRDLVEMQNCLLSYSFLKGNLPESFEHFFQKCSEIHSIPTRLNNSECLYMSRVRSVTYGMNSITNNCIRSWNNLAQILESPSTLPLSEIKSRMFNYYIESY